MKQELRAFGYVRVSVDEEGGGNNASIASQVEAIEAHAAREGIEIVEIFREPNVSGHKLARKEFDRMIDAATSPERPVHQVIVYNLTRFSRRLMTQIVSEHRLTQAQVQLISVTENFSQDANGTMMRNLFAVMNEKVVLDASTFTKKDRRQNAKNGFWNGGPIPFGYRSFTAKTDGNKERKKLAIIQDEAEIVQMIFDLAQHGLTGQPMGTRSIAKYLNANGYTLRGGKFLHGNVDGILTREHYAGSYRDRTANDQGIRPTDAEAIVVPCPVIIPPDIVAAVAAKRAKAAPRVTPPRVTNGPTLLTGIAKCGSPGCDAGMTIRTGKGGRYRYYTCNTRASAGACACDTRAIRDDTLDPLVIDTLMTRILQPERLTVLLAHVLEKSDDAMQKRKADLKRIHKARIEAEKRVRNLYDLIEEGLESARDRQFAQRLSERKQKVAELEARERSLTAQLGGTTPSITMEVVERFGRTLADRIRNGDPALTRTWVRLFVDQVTVSNDEIVIRGTKRALEAALVHGEKSGIPVVPSFDLKWCPEEASHSNFFSV